MDDYILDIVLSVDETRAYTASNASNGHMKVIDISDMNSVHIIGSFIDFQKGYEYEESYEGDYSVQVGVTLSNDGKKAYLSDGFSGIYVINVCE